MTSFVEALVGGHIYGIFPWVQLFFFAMVNGRAFSHFLSENWNLCPKSVPFVTFLDNSVGTPTHLFKIIDSLFAS